MKIIFCSLGLALAGVGLGIGEENSLQRLNSAQQGIAEASWPRKPDNRLSPLSGKMMDTPALAPRLLGTDQEFRAPKLERWQKESRLGSMSLWEQETKNSWVETRWKQGQFSSEERQKNQTFDPAMELAGKKTLDPREVERPDAPEWSVRASKLGHRKNDSLNMYEGRLTRVRQQVWQEENNRRDLGPERQEKFRPEEVEKMLAQPAGSIGQAATGRSPSAYPLAAAGNSPD